MRPATLRVAAEPATTATLRVLLAPGDLQAQLREDVLVGLGSRPLELPPKWFYDERGSELFDRITRLPEYYLTRRERAILVECAPEIAALSRADTLVELGSGTSEKTRLLLDALSQAGLLRRFVPIDVSREVLERSAAAIADRYPGIEVSALVADFEQHLSEMPTGGTRMVAFLGSTIGNFSPVRRAAFFAELGGLLGAGDSLLIGLDLVKAPARLEAAYDDAAGVTAEFNRNVLRVLNRELGADFAVDAFEHVARYDADARWIEMLLRSTVDQRVRVGELGIELAFTAGQEIRTEISAKLTLAGISEELAAAGLAVERVWTDRARDFALCLAFAA